MTKTTIDFTFIDNSDAVIEEIVNLAKDGLIEVADIFVKETKKNIKSHTNQLADGVMAQDRNEMRVASDFTNINIELGYLTQMSFKKNVRKGTFYPNPYWIEYGTKAHEIQTKELKQKQEKLTYQLTDLSGQQYGYDVQNPGTKAHNHLRNAGITKFNEARNVLIDNLKKVETAELNAMKSKKIKYKKEYFV